MCDGHGDGFSSSDTVHKTIFDIPREAPAVTDGAIMNRGLLSGQAAGEERTGSVPSGVR